MTADRRSESVCLLLQRKLKSLIGNYTFLEAYERTGRILNVSVCPADTNEPARLLNYLTAPQVRRAAAAERRCRWAPFSVCLCMLRHSYFCAPSRFTSM
jgi:hypothetical protein